ncbi:MAG: hypothetical protein JO027_02875 [Solirubrobacterales bacterium]|nr:hypothetical protein [Solirubrobacterales bacterium]
MPVDRAAAETFIWSTARLVDRHRYAMRFAGGPAEPVIASLAGYQNPDGGFGHGLEPDLRGPESQPGPTMYALEILLEAGMLDTAMGRAARAWLARVAEPDGGIRTALPGFESYPHAPWWTAEPKSSFLTFGLAAVLHAGAVGEDEWLARATDWCWRSIEAERQPSAYWLKYACAFLDSVPDADRANAALEALGGSVDASAIAPAGGAEGEALRPLDLSPRPGTRSRALVGEPDVEAHLDAVEAEQLEDGGWMFDWPAWSLAQTADWRGNVTIRALGWLHDNGRIA